MLIIEFISKPWAWYVAGPAITLVMFLLLYFGGQFGVSSNLRTVCAAVGGDKLSDFFKFNWKEQIWNLVFIGGAIIGGFIATEFLTPTQELALNPNTIQKLQALGFENPGAEYLPAEIFGTESVLSFSGMLILLVGGFLVGFGARYGGGCTSGHAISGISNLQIPSVIAVIGFFIGGLIMSHLLLPIIF